jgi:alcohol dehydrogenase class IV
VRAGYEIARQFETDVILALGGGSAIDAAKAIWTLCETPQASLEELISAGFDPLPRRRGSVKMIAIPSTSGAGSEVGRVAVLTDRRSTPPRKLPLFTGCPDWAILDPALPATMPPHLAADSGYDALVHAVESFVSVNSHAFSRSLSAGTARTVLQHLRASVQGEYSAREQVHYAATMAGATMRVGLGLTHAIAHQITPVLGVPHGRANAILLPHVIAFNAATVPQLYVELAQWLGLDIKSDAAKVLLQKLEKLRDEIGIPASFQAAGVDEKRWRECVPQLAANALEDLNCNSNPRVPTQEEIEQLLWRAWAGEAAAYSG